MKTATLNRDGQVLTFKQISKKNTLNSNLTELNATDAVNNGFMSHNDWVAHVTRYGFEAKWIARNHPASVLDVGCGRFPFLNYLWRNRSVESFSYVGLDLRANERWFEHLGWKKGPVMLLQGDLVADNFGLDEFNLVICTEVFEHVPREKARKFMKQLYAWTAPGGTVIFSTPNAGVSDSTADNHKDENGVSREWTYEDKVNIARDAGFNIDATYGTFIAKKRIPEDFWTVTNRKAEEFLPHAMFTVFAASGYPRESNNALFVLSRGFE